MEKNPLDNIPYKEHTFHVFGIDGLNLDELWKKSADILSETYSMTLGHGEVESDGDCYHTTALALFYSTQEVQVTYFDVDKPHIHIEIPWLGSYGDVFVAFSLLKALRALYPSCEIYYNDDIDKGQFVLQEENIHAIMTMCFRNMVYLIENTEKGEHIVVPGMNRNFTVPTKEEFPDLSMEEMTEKAVNMYVDLQWKYMDYEDARTEKVSKKGSDEKQIAALLDNKQDVFVPLCQTVFLFGPDDLCKAVSEKTFLEKTKDCEYIEMADSLQFIMKKMPDNEWDALYDSIDSDEYWVKDLLHNTYLLRWNPLISSFKLDEYREATTKCPDGFSLNWSVYEWEHAEEGDHYYMLRTGDDKAGIIFWGWFTSDPFEGEDWAGKGQPRHYMDMVSVDAVGADDEPRITVEELEAAIPNVDWRKGHSGELLSPEDAQTLRELFNSKLESKE